MIAQVRKSTIYLTIFFGYTFLFLTFIGIDAIKGNIDFEFYADSETYMEMAAEGREYAEMLLINPNLIGPYTVLKLLGSNYYLVFILNWIIFCGFFIKVGNLYDLDRKVLLFFLFISPIMFGSLIGINKEIFSLLVLTNLLIFAKNRNYIYVILALLFSVLVRWQLSLFVVVFVAITHYFNPFKHKRLLSLLIFLTIVSITYPINLDAFEDVDSTAMMAMENRSEGSGLYSLLILIQNYPFGYIFAFVPKMLFLFGGTIFRYYKFFDFTELYNNVFIFSQGVLNILALLMVLRRKLGLANDFIFMAVLYAMIFCLSPIYSPRYLFPCYILLICALSQKKVELKTLSC